MTDAEKAKAYDELVERLRGWAERGRRQVSGDTRERFKGYDDCLLDFMRDVVAKLPPRPPKVVEVPWHEAIEGLIEGEFSRATPITGCEHGVWFVWHEGLLSYESGLEEATVGTAELGTWRAELADV